MSNEKWYKSSYRRNLVDMHIDAWNEEFLSQFDPRSYFKCLKAANIKSPMIYTHSHVGYCNWPSKSGEMHPGFKGCDKIKELFNLCHNDGMDVIAYYSLIYNNWAYENHPEWRMLNIDGLPSRSVKKADKDMQNLLMMIGQGRYGLVCPNSTGYREFIKAQFEELCENYSFEGIFLDMTFWPMICYCDSCKKRFREETGMNLPEVIDWNDHVWLRFQQAREEWIGEFASFATTELKKLRPDVDIEHQFSTCTHPWTFGVRTSVSDASDYTGGDLYGGFEQQSFICKMYYGLTNNQPFEYMTSRCDPSLHDHTTTKSLEMLKLHAYLTYAHHGAFLAIDAIDPRGTLNTKFYNQLGEVFRETSAYEPYYKGELKADVTIYFSLGSKMDVRAGGRKRAFISRPETYQHIECALGAAIALRKAHIPYSVVTDGKYNDIDGAKVLILSDIAFMTEDEENKITDYVQNGGNLYISGISSPKVLKKLMDINIYSSTKENVTYIRPTANGIQYFCGMYDEQYPMTVFGTQMLAEHDGTHTVLATVTLPYTDPKDLSVFASIHSNPPGIDTDIPSIIYGTCGKGKVIWSATPFESSNQIMHKQVFINLINVLTDNNNLVLSNAPKMIEFTVFDDIMHKKIQLHCVNLQEEFPMIKIGGFDVKVRIEKPVKSVKNLPSGEPVSFIGRDGYVDIHVDCIDIFRMFEIEY